MFSFGISGHPETWSALEKLHGAIIGFKTSPQLLLQSCFPVKLQNCSVDNETPTDFPSAWGGGEINSHFWVNFPFIKPFHLETGNSQTAFMQ